MCVGIFLILLLLMMMMILKVIAACEIFLGLRVFGSSAAASLVF
jgi:hypothetical protein